MRRYLIAGLAGAMLAALVFVAVLYFADLGVSQKSEPQGRTASPTSATGTHGGSGIDWDTGSGIDW